MRELINLSALGVRRMLSPLAALFLFVSTAFAQSERDFWIEQMLKIANPVLINTANNTLHKNMPVFADRSKYQHLEAFGRTVCGIAPWIELGPDSSNEGRLRQQIRDLTIQAITNAFDPKAADYMNFSIGNQPLVDAAYLAQGLLRSPTQLWAQLDTTTKTRIINEFQSLRRISGYENNWMLFSSIVEASLLKFSGECDVERLTYGIKRFMREYYLGDGIYGDGSSFAMNYYNSYVIHPMLVDALNVAISKKLVRKDEYDIEVKRLSRFAEIQERFVSPEGYYPVIGRTLICRMGAFNALSFAALTHNVSPKLAAGQVRSCLTKVLQNQLKSDSNFYADGFLKVGFAGEQEEFTESYVSSGSTYHCTTIFLALGLNKSDPFWTEPFQKWTSLKAFTGEEFPPDHALEDFNSRYKIKKYLWGIYYYHFEVKDIIIVSLLFIALFGVIGSIFFLLGKNRPITSKSTM